MRTRRFMTLACVGLMVLAVGCRDRSTVQDKEDTLCVKLGQLDQTVTQIASLAASKGNPAQLTSLRAEADARYKAAQDAAKKTPNLNSSMANVNTAYNNFVKSLNGVNNDATLAAAQPNIDHAASDFSAARLDLYDTAGCA